MKTFKSYAHADTMVACLLAECATPSIPKALGGFIVAGEVFLHLHKSLGRGNHHFLLRLAIINCAALQLVICYLDELR